MANSYELPDHARAMALVVNHAPHMMQVQHYVAEKNVAEVLLQEKIAERHNLRRSLGETHS